MFENFSFGKTVTGISKPEFWSRLGSLTVQVGLEMLIGGIIIGGIIAVASYFGTRKLLRWYRAKYPHRHKNGVGAWFIIFEFIWNLRFTRRWADYCRAMPFCHSELDGVAIAEDIQYRNESAKPCRPCDLRGNLAGEKFPELFEPFAGLCQPSNPARLGG